ncbi:MAG: tRNA epoxyqueuosine(34) reductase QueG [Bacteroidetes bacterium]|nr:tRNA epoxyqueuosine(34) reductase QueG [Bacteroidota bacterium]
MQPLADDIKIWAGELGFLDCGIAKAEFLKDEENHLNEWLQKGYEASMNWMHNHKEKRLDPSVLVPGAKSVISVLFNYFPESERSDPTARIAKYAYGKDYHFVLKEKLNQLALRIQSQTGEFQYRIFVDSAPVMERPLAVKAGLGWIGKHSLLINKRLGSFFFIGQIICDLELKTDSAQTDHCGNCTACIDACPTNAIVEDKVIDANKCISYLTIEHRGEIDSAFKNQFNNWIFGCDICQDVCPWNRFSKPHQEQNFMPTEKMLNYTLEEWEMMTTGEFKKMFAASPIRRTGYKGFKRNLEYVKNKANGRE